MVDAMGDGSEAASVQRPATVGDAVKIFEKPLPLQVFMMTFENGQNGLFTNYNQTCLK